MRTGAGYIAIMPIGEAGEAIIATRTADRFSPLFVARVIELDDLHIECATVIRVTGYIPIPATSK